MRTTPTPSDRPDRERSVLHHESHRTTRSRDRHLARAARRCRRVRRRRRRSGGSRAPVPGVTDTEIVVGTHMPLTGPAAAGYSKIAPATKAYFDYVNANGGVHGRKITYKIMDDGYNPANTQQVVRQLVLQDKVFAILNGLGTPDPHRRARLPQDQPGARPVRRLRQPELEPAGQVPGHVRLQPRLHGRGQDPRQLRQDRPAPGKKVCFLGQDDDFGRDSLAGVEKILGAGAVAAKQTYVTSNTERRPADRRVQGGRLPGRHAGHRARLHRAVHRHRGQARLQAAVAWSPTSAPTTTRWPSRSARPRRCSRAWSAANYLPMNNDDGEPVDPALQEGQQASTTATPPFDGNIVYGMSVGYLFVQALQAAGKDLTREG